jgi:hypothetical protein
MTALKKGKPRIYTNFHQFTFIYGEESFVMIGENSWLSGFFSGVTDENYIARTFI